MLRFEAFQYERMPKGRARLTCPFTGARRFVFNKGLALEKERYERGRKKLGYADFCRLLTEWRHSAETARLAGMPVHPFEQSPKRLARHQRSLARKQRLPKNGT